jgi:hypothetical protein
MHLWNIGNFRKDIFGSLMVTLLILTFLMAMLPSVAAQAGSAMYAPPLTVIPTIDGIWSAGECYVRVKHNDSHLFMIIDSPWDTTNASVYDTENLWVAFDTAHNRGSVPQTDDWLFDNPHSSKQVDMESWNGTGTGWSDPTFEPNATDYWAEGCTRVPWGGGGIGPQPSPHNATDHRIDEIMMPRQFVTTGNEAGLYILVVDDTDASKYVEWPSWAGGNSWGWPPFDDPCPAPNAWGTLVLQTKYGMYAPPLTVTPTIDGIWSSSEWDDAPQYTMYSIVGNIGYIRAKFNNTHLFVLVDSPWDTTPINLTSYWNENFWLAFDTYHDGGWGAPQSDDYLIHAATDNTPPNGTGMGWVGNASAWDMQWLGWTGDIRLMQSGSFNVSGIIPLQTSPNSASPHRISEAMIPLWPFVGSYGSTVGFYAQVDDDSTDPDGYNFTLSATSYCEWPPTAGGVTGWPSAWSPPSVPCPPPSAWGDLILAAPVGGTVLVVDKLSLLAPYIALVSMITVAGIAAVYFIRRKKLR